ncbi:ribonuclease kappa-B-like isoform X2 [Xenia sp. Carnegie-2017]|uniref:ribonuclease kappa-B-like isoform X2 n=1 Tax=Xenia sp. Carnegie-2017 TaxID=2897299 RepID=UPI001F03822D|nr:ribonuclease kappa-B-like isoform X2 [Xenia sp. Carnegie-2017]
MAKCGGCTMGPKSANCCLVLSFWGIIMLVFLGIFFHLKSVALVEDVDKQNDYGKTSRNCFFAAGLYMVTFVISAYQKWRIHRMPSEKILKIESH